MKIKDIIAKINKDDPNLHSSVDWESLARELRVDNLFYSESTRLKAYWFEVWYCTDSYVGRRAYFLDNKLVCISFQSCRKGDEEFQFTSKLNAEKVKNYLLSLVEQPDAEISLADLDEELTDQYSIEYSSQLMGNFHKYAMLIPDNVKVEILAARDDYKSFHDTLVKFPNGEEKIVDVRYLKFDYAQSYSNGRILRLQ